MMLSELPALLAENEFVLLKLSSEHVAIGIGPFEYTALKPDNQTAFYLQDFYLRSAQPWIVPSQCLVARCDELSELFFEGECPSFALRDAEISCYEPAFKAVMERISLGSIDKAVPVIFSELHLEKLPRERVIARLLRNTSIQHGFYISLQKLQMAGASPEILIERRASNLNCLLSEAVAGTATLPTESLLHESQRISLEQQLVVDDLTKQLSRFGEVQLSFKRRYALGNLVHLYSEIQTHTRNTVPLEELVSALHPTGAIGILPRQAIASHEFRLLDPMNCREFYGAPFGVAFSDGSFKITITIRSILGKDGKLLVGSGGGLVRGCVLAEEWQELRHKRESVVSLLIK